MDSPTASAVQDTTLVYGPTDARHRLDIYADPRCPFCKRVEIGLGPTLRGLADDGRFVLRHHFATFLDEGLGGTGSYRAVNALRAAADVGQAPFLDYVAVLYARQPDENDDAFADPEHLIALADDVPGLRSAEFDRAVREFAHREWVGRAQEAFERSGVTGTPVVALDGAALAVLDASGDAVGPDRFLAQVE